MACYLGLSRCNRRVGKEFVPPVGSRCRPGREVGFFIWVAGFLERGGQNRRQGLDSEPPGWRPWPGVWPSPQNPGIPRFRFPYYDPPSAACCLGTELSGTEILGLQAGGEAINYTQVKHPERLRPGHTVLGPGMKPSGHCLPGTGEIMAVQGGTRQIRLLCCTPTSIYSDAPPFQFFSLLTYYDNTLIQSTRTQHSTAPSPAPRAYTSPIPRTPTANKPGRAHACAHTRWGDTQQRFSLLR